MAENIPLLAIDIGNSRIKLGWFGDCPRSGELPLASLPSPGATLEVETRATDLSLVGQWIKTLPEAPVWIASVNRPATERIRTALSFLGTPPRLLTAGDLPLAVKLDHPDRVGIDRLLSAVAANALRQRDRAAVVVSVGTAITVNWIAVDGSFQGGAIMPGITMSAQALHQFTDQLPLIPMAELSDAPPALGTSTIEAMRSGLFWGAVGGVRELIAQLRTAAGTDVDVFLTGGAGAGVAKLIHLNARFEAHLVLAGIAVSLQCSRVADRLGGLAK